MKIKNLPVAVPRQSAAKSLGSPASRRQAIPPSSFSLLHSAFKTKTRRRKPAGVPRSLQTSPTSVAIRMAKPKSESHHRRGRVAHWRRTINRCGRTIHRSRSAIRGCWRVINRSRLHIHHPRLRINHRSPIPNHRSRESNRHTHPGLRRRSTRSGDCQHSQHRQT
jgi:hypothetical protein